MIDKSDKTQTEELYLEKIRSLVRDIKYGNITLIIQDGKVIQIDKTEKFRFKN